MLLARYALCTALDEAVLSTPWGSGGDWGKQSLLITVHNEAWGGEKVFQLLDIACKARASACTCWSCCTCASAWASKAVTG